MATKKTATTKAARKTAKPRSGSAAAQKRAPKEKGEQTEKKPRARQFTEKQLRSMLNMLLHQYAAQVKDGDVRLTPSEGFKLMQLQESLGLMKPSDVKVEWVEPKG
jgi:nitric oxide reductase activation protein